MKLYTVKAKELLLIAELLEHDADNSLRARIILGNTDKYFEEKHAASILRRAAFEKSVYVRREILRNNGFELIKL